MRVAKCSPVLDKNLAPMGPEILSNTRAGVWRKAPKAFPDSSSVLDKFQSAICVVAFKHFNTEQMGAEGLGPALVTPAEPLKSRPWVL